MQRPIEALDHKSKLILTMLQPMNANNKNSICKNREYKFKKYLQIKKLQFEAVKNTENLCHIQDLHIASIASITNF